MKKYRLWLMQCNTEVVVLRHIYLSSAFNHFHSVYTLTDMYFRLIKEPDIKATWKFHSTNSSTGSITTLGKKESIVMVR